MTQELTKVPIIGFVRYSQKIDFGGIKDMFEPEYFEYRFHIFKDITLKSFQSQTNKNFLLLILHSENIPPHYKERFFALEKDNMFLKNIFVADTSEAFEEALQNSFHYLNFQNDAAVTFRIDNDDAIQYDFIEKMRKFVKRDFVGYVISMPMIYITKRISDKSYMIEERYYPSNSIGMAYVTGRENYKTVLQVGQHHLVNDEMPVVLLSKNFAAGLQTINGENAINSIDSKFAKILSDEEFNKYLLANKLENLEINCLRIFPDINVSSKFSPTAQIRLFIPPIFFIMMRKIRDFF